MGRKPKFDAPVEAPLRARGRVLYEALAPAGSNVAQQAIALEAARLADRLDALNDAIESDGVIELMHYRMRGWIDEEAGVASIVVSVDAVLGEARQTAGQFERVLRAALAGVDLAKPTTGGVADGVDELKARREREQRERTSAGGKPATSRRGAAPAGS